jgi:hypothetical protein
MHGLDNGKRFTVAVRLAHQNIAHVLDQVFVAMLPSARYGTRWRVENNYRSLTVKLWMDRSHCALQSGINADEDHCAYHPFFSIHSRLKLLTGTSPLSTKPMQLLRTT